MTRTPRIPLSALLAGVLFAAPAAAQEPIRFARTPDISPDGKLVAFSYLGDIWVVETIGGTARPITSHPAHDVNPVFSPDGRSIAFSSNRHGSYDVYVVAAHGGRPKRLTTDSGSDLVSGWSPDGKQVLYASTRSTAFPPSFELYTVPVEGGMSHRVSAAEGKEGVYSPAGDRIAYVRGPGTWYRKGYRGSSNDDVWLSKADGTDNHRLTDFNGQDGSPMWGADGHTVYYVSEFFGTPANIVKKPADGSQGVPPLQLTHHTEDGVRRARISKNGEWIVYECGPDLWVVSTRDGSQPRKLAIEVYADDKANTERIETFTRGATEFAVSPDEKYVAFAVHGNLFLQPVSLQASKAVRLTETAANDHGIAWAPDGSKILFISDRNGKEDIYLLEGNDPEHSRFVEAHQFKVTPLTNTADAEFGLSFTPDGKRVGFLRAGKLWTMKPDGTDTKVVIDAVQVVDYEWSPDGKWVVYARRDGSFASELYVVPSTGPTAENPPRNITRYATSNSDVTWSADGRMIAFLSERRGPANLFVLPLQKPTGQGVTEKTATPTSPVVDFDWEDLHLRAHSAVPVPVSEAVISPDGSKIAFRASNQGEDLWIASTTGGQMSRLTTGGQFPHQIHWSRKRSPFGGTTDIVYFLDGSGSIRMARPSVMGMRSSGSGGPTPGSGSISSLVGGEIGGSGESITIPFKVTLTIRNEDLYVEMFDQSWRYLSEHFYDAKFHGSNWEAVRAKYRPLVAHVALKEDLYSLLYLMLGELNASHLGVTGFGTRPDQVTADLGLIFDETYRGKGLKIAEVLKRGPADRRGLNLKAGEYVVAIDGVEITDTTDLSKLLNDKADESVAVQVTSDPATDPKDPKARRRIEIKAAKREEISSLMYDRWVRRNATRVSELSKGKLGYIHIPSMDEDGLDRFVRSLYSDNFDKEAIVLDVRFNGGGFTHDQVLNYLGAREHTFFRQRDGGEGFVLRPYDRKWTKPLVVLINNRSYSDAEIFPNAFRTLGLGKLVGEPTGGFVIGTGAVRLVDGSMFRIPRIGVYTSKGINMEKEGVQPDVLVEPHPDQLAKGIDAQLDKAVDVLQEEVIAFKKKASGGVASTGRPVERDPQPVTPAPATPTVGTK
jgi:tricorn protease